nr:hypothetical protein [Tanacetum cinerariifolium]
MAFRNFIYTEDVEDLLFLPKEPSSGFSAGSPFVLVNTKPLKADEELVIRLAEVMADSRESLMPELFVVHHGSVATQIKDMKYKTSRDDVPYLTVSDDDEDVTACRLKIFAITPLAWKNHLDMHMDVELLDLHDHCYTRQAVADNNPTIVALQEKISTLFTEVKEHKERRAYEQVIDMKEPFDLSKVKGYRSSYKKDRTQASTDLATVTFPWLDEFVADPSAPIEALLSKKPPSLQRPSPSRTQVSLPSSQRATSSSILVSNLMSPPAEVFVMNPQSF